MFSYRQQRSIMEIIQAAAMGIYAPKGVARGARGIPGSNITKKIRYRRKAVSKEQQAFKMARCAEKQAIKQVNRRRQYDRGIAHQPIDMHCGVIPYSWLTEPGEAS